jgi:AraC family transcriptional regulator of arabinose operon
MPPRINIPRKTHLPPPDRAYWQVAQDTLPLLYLAWGRRDYSSSPIPVSRHEGWIYFLVQTGAPTVTLEGGPRILGAGSLLVIGPECAYGLSAGRCKTLCWMWRKPVNDVLAALPPETFMELRVPPGEIEDFAPLHALCRDEVMRSDAHSANALGGCQHLIESRIARLINGPDGNVDSTALKLNLARHWIPQHLDCPEPVSRLCDYLDISPAALNRLFRSNTGMSAMRYHHELRMNAALNWIKQGGMSIKEVAFALGYRHFNDFSRAFRIHFGRVPTEVPVDAGAGGRNARSAARKSK